ncbi:MAG: FAD-binding oxidoreductase [Actinobacteria bacterium]|nr:FAD-binding oxidoreductase [Actinomycetota bacterium]
MNSANLALQKTRLRFQLEVDVTRIKPSTPIEFAKPAKDVSDRIVGASQELTAQLVEALAKICPTTTDLADRLEHSRDWWPLAMHWSLAGKTARRAGAICRPTTTTQVSQVVGVCAKSSVPVTVAGGRSGVCGAAIPVFGGVVVDTTELSGVVGVDEKSGLVEVLPGTFGPDLENEINTKHKLSVGHFPQSFDISTVGGWIGSRGAGQFSTRYGKIDDMVAGLEVVLADGTIVNTGVEPAGSAGPNLTSLFIGSEGTLGIVTKVWLRAHPLPQCTKKMAFKFASFAAGVEAMRTAIRHGATPAVLRLYDARESKRSHGGENEQCTLIVLDEGTETIVDATCQVVREAALANAAIETESGLVDNWLAHRNDTSGLQILARRGFVIDTMEVAVKWSRIDRVAQAVKDAIMKVAGARSATCHISHSYIDGACVYFTFVAEPADQEIGSIEAKYDEIWNAAQESALQFGANLSHHHGVGINRAKYLKQALGPAHEILRSLKRALDPNDVLNPGKFALPSRHGDYEIG